MTPTKPTPADVLLATMPMDDSLPRYVEVLGMLPDSFCTKIIIDRSRISVIEPVKYRIRVDGVWIVLYNEEAKRCGPSYNDTKR